MILNCVDFMHHVSGGQTWNANLSNLATGAGVGSWTRNGNINLYKQAAYLTTMYGQATNTADVTNIQVSIWNLFQNTNLNYVSGGSKSNASYWLTTSASNDASMNMNGWFVVTDVNKAQSNSVQEFLMYTPTSTTATPEPASLVLLGTGLLGVGLAGRRRRRKS